MPGNHFMNAKTKSCRRPRARIQSKDTEIQVVEGTAKEMPGKHFMNAKNEKL